jgi:hypothetical protein
MRGPMLSGFVVLVSISGCSSMHPPSKSATPAPTTQAEPPANGGTERTSAPPAQGAEPAQGSGNTKPPSDTHAPKQPAQSAVAPATAHPPPATAAIKPPAATLDLKGLEQRLRDTRAIGVFTKLSLKNQVDDLLGEFRLLYQGPNKHPSAQLRQRYDQLLLKVLGLLQEGDPQLAAAIASSREAIWNILADPEKFAKI